MKIKEKIFDLKTKSEIIIEREMNADELAAYNSGLIELETTLRLKKEQEEAKKTVLEKLGITEEEAKLLLS